MGPIYEAAADLLKEAGRPIVAVGDVVSYHLAEAGHEPKVIVVDGVTEREAVDESVAGGLPTADRTVTVENPAATVTAELVAAIEAGLEQPGTTTIDVDGEEDLAVLPAVFLAPDGATVVYGQPGEGMVAVSVNAEGRELTRERLRAMEYEESFWRDLGAGES